MPSNIKKSLCLKIIIPTLLLIFGISNLINYFKSSDFSILNLDVRGDASHLTGLKEGPLLKGDVVHGKFNSPYTNLGMVLVRFYNLDRDSNDVLIFRLREEGQKSWYYEAKYKTDQFSPHKLFPFGFPIITNSNGNNYEFEIESMNGTIDNGILIENEYPVMLAKSTYTKKDLLDNTNTLFYFVGHKFVNMFGDSLLLLNSLFFFLPLIFLILYFFSKGVSFQFLTSIAVIFILYDIFWLKFSHDYLFVGVLFLWGLTSYRFRFSSKVATLSALCLLLMTPIMYFLNKNAIAEQMAIWAYLFLCISIVQNIYEYKIFPKNQLSLKK